MTPLFDIDGDRALDMDRVIPRLWIGSYAAARMLRFSNPYGISLLVHCTEAPLILPDEISERRLPMGSRREGGRHRVEGDALSFVLSCMHAWREEDHREVMVMCSSGVSRSAAICSAYLVRHGDCSWAEAVARVKTARSIVEIERDIEREVRAALEKVMVPA